MPLRYNPYRLTHAISLDATYQHAIEWLAEAGPVGAYGANGAKASEPTAWATIALAKAGKNDAAQLGADWLAKHQQADGSVGVTETEATPGWPTSLAILAWQTVNPSQYAPAIERGIDWALGQKPWTKERDRIFGHDTTLEGWSWAPHTHSWLEPTAFFVAAFRQTGRTESKRFSQAVRLLVDRLLPAGGANYGNTVVLGQELLQHVQPTGIVAWALAEESIDAARYASTLDYLQQAAIKPTGAASLAYAVLGLAANRVDTSRYDDALHDAWERAQQAGGVYKPALIALAAEASLANRSNTLAGQS